MKTKNLFPVATILMLTGISWGATHDTTPPRLLSIAIAPTVIDTSTNSQAVLLTVRLSDDLSGITAAGPGMPSQARASAMFRSPVGGLSASVAGVYFDASMRVSGDELDGVYTNSLILPRYTHAGNWTLIAFDVADAVGNHKQMSFTELRSLGFPTQFTVQGVDDRIPPSIVSATFSPNKVDTSISNQPVIVTVHLRDDLAGMDGSMSLSSYMQCSISFVSPSKEQRVGTYFAPAMRASGNQYDGVYTNTLWLPRYSGPGTWSLDSLSLSDAAGNRQTIDLAGALDLGLQVDFTVQGAGDTSPPQMRALDYFPRRIDTSYSNQTISFSVRLADAMSGMSNYVSWGYAHLSFLSPSKGQSAGISFNSWTRTAGTDWDGVYTNSMILPRYSETGVWTLQYFDMTDAAGNRTTLDWTALRELGFPTQFAIGITPTLRIARQAESILVSWPNWASDFTLQSLTNLDQSAGWVPVGMQPVIFGEDAVVAVPKSAGRAFYRLSELP